MFLLDDFNYHVNSEANAYTTEFLGFPECFGLKNHVEIETHVKDNTLDLVITREYPEDSITILKTGQCFDVVLRYAIICDIASCKIQNFKASTTRLFSNKFFGTQRDQGNNVGTTSLNSCIVKAYSTHWGRATHICVGKLTIIGSDNGLSPGWRQAIIWTNDGILLIRPLGINFSGILIGNQTFSLKKMHLKMSSAKWCPFYLGLSVLSQSNVRNKCRTMPIKNPIKIDYKCGSIAQHSWMFQTYHWKKTRFQDDCSMICVGGPHQEETIILPDPSYKGDVITYHTIKTNEFVTRVSRG